MPAWGVDRVQVLQPPARRWRGRPRPYLLLAAEHGVPSGQLRGTTQNDIVKEYLSRGTYAFPPAPSMRLIADMIAFTVDEVPKWNPINICSYHLQEAGATPVQELAYALATAIGAGANTTAANQVTLGGAGSAVPRSSPAPRAAAMCPASSTAFRNAFVLLALTPADSRALSSGPTSPTCWASRGSGARPSSRPTPSAPGLASPAACSGWPRPGRSQPTRGRRSRAVRPYRRARCCSQGH